MSLKEVTQNKSFILTLRTTQGFYQYKKVYIQSLKNLQKILKLLPENYVVENIETCSDNFIWDKEFIKEISKDLEEGLVT